MVFVHWNSKQTLLLLYIYYIETLYYNSTNYSTHERAVESTINVVSIFECIILTEKWKRKWLLLQNRTINGFVK